MTTASFTDVDRSRLTAERPVAYPSAVTPPPARPPGPRGPQGPRARRGSSAGAGGGGGAGSTAWDEGGEARAALGQELRELARATSRPEVLASLGGVAGLFKVPERYREPLLVARAREVGPKLALAARAGRWDTVGIDCVAGVANDLAAQGAEPLVFLHHLAPGPLGPESVTEAVRGLAEGCRRAGCALLAAEPELPAPGGPALAGFGVGVVERDGVVDGSGIRIGDAVVALSAGGLHATGLERAAALVDEGDLDLFAEDEELNTTLAGALLAPARVYARPVLNLLRDFPLHGIVHVGEGGLAEGLPRVLPKGLRARLTRGAWPMPPVVEWLRRRSGLADADTAEVLRATGGGLGLVLFVPREHAEDVCDRLVALGERPHRIGRVERRAPDDPALLVVEGEEAATWRAGAGEPGRRSRGSGGGPGSEPS